jgi:Protein kinase domain
LGGPVIGMDTKAVVARFEAERQALAMMDHPNIAKVLDAGIAQTGRPFFVMELVRGVSITEYCNGQRSPTRERLELFIKVCQAIQHAHQKGIIHRDIKPSNILVTMHDGTPVPKVIDFGIAKATEGRLTDATVYTQLHQFVGTPAYMSPEQAEMTGIDIDTRSDIYSLGVVLYELLAGCTPFTARELMVSGVDAMRRILREKEPMRPSTRFATDHGEELTASGRRRFPETTKRLEQLQGDLDWIVMKCLEKDRTHRYETANGLAADLRRHLDNEPVLARPPSAAYRLQKAWGRNKLMFGAAGAIVAGLLFAMSALSLALVRERARKSESVRADSIAAFVTRLLHAAVPELIQQGDSRGVRLLLDSADDLVTKTLTNAPAAELTLREALGFFQGVQLANQPKSRTQYDRVEALLPLVPDDRLPPNRSRDDLRIDAAYARLFAGAVERGRADLEALAKEFLQRGPGANRVRARTLAMLGYGLFAMDQSVQAEPLLAEAFRLEPGRTASGLYLIDFAGVPYAQVLIRNGRYELAAEVARKTLSQLTADLGEVAILDYSLLVEADCKLGRIQAARKLIEEQVGHAASQAWTPEQLLSLRVLQSAITAYSGGWREAALDFVTLATNESAGIDDWSLGAAAALASGDTNAAANLWRFGRTRYAGTAGASQLCVGG